MMVKMMNDVGAGMQYNLLMMMSRNDGSRCFNAVVSLWVSRAVVRLSQTSLSRRTDGASGGVCRPRELCEWEMPR